MKCENYFCVYQDNGKCILDEINIDIMGQCDSCIYIDIPKFELEKYKKLLKNKFINEKNI